MSGRKMIHVLSTGCVGSCYTGGTINEHPDVIKYFFEPFNGHSGSTNKLIQCFQLNKCDDPKVRSQLKLSDDDVSQMSHSPILFKTTQFRRLDLLVDVLNENPDVLDDYYIVFNIRDPRGAHNTCAKYPNWSESHAPTLCGKFMQIANGLRNLTQNVRGKIKIIGIYNEYISTLYPNEFRELLFNFLELDLNIPKQIEGIEVEQEGYNRFEKASYSSRWINEKTLDDILKIQSYGDCAKWMEEFGFKKIHDESEKSSTALLTIGEMIGTRNPYPIHADLLPATEQGIDREFRPSTTIEKVDELDVAMGMVPELNEAEVELNIPSLTPIPSPRGTRDAFYLCAFFFVIVISLLMSGCKRWTRFATRR